MTKPTTRTLSIPSLRVMAWLSWLTLATAGCTVFPEREPPRMMDLPPPAVMVPSSRTLDGVLRVDMPEASAPFDGNRILAKPAPQEYLAYPGVRWRDTPPVLIRELMMASLRRSQGFATVISESSPASSQFALVSDLYAFQREGDGNDTHARIGLYVQLIDNHSREAVCSRDFAIKAPAASDRMEDVVDAFTTAGQLLAKELAGWLETCRG